MRCRRCGEKPIIHLPQHRAAFCKPCFVHFFQQQVERAIRHEHMFTPGDRILVAVSGGKDSLALWDVLLDLGYDATGLYVHLGVEEGYSLASKEKSEKFARSREVRLITVDLQERFGLDVAEVAQYSRRHACSGCGLIKRYVFNEVALQEGFDVLATGHNLDDEAARLLGNLLHWQVEYLSKQSPVLPCDHPKFVKKVKPLYRLGEKETATYAFARGIDYVVDECPKSDGAVSLVYKEMLDKLEALSPGTKQHFVYGFLKNLHRFEEASSPLNYRECARCGALTPMELCAMCRLQDEVRRRKEQHPALQLVG